MPPTAPSGITRELAGAEIDRARQERIEPRRLRQCLAFQAGKDSFSAYVSTVSLGDGDAALAEDFSLDSKDIGRVDFPVRPLLHHRYVAHGDHRSFFRTR
jgi:hypothetical protein